MRTSFKALTLMAILLWFGSVIGCSGSKTDPEQIKTIELPALTGEPYKLAPTDTQVTLFVFWATWCGPCLMEIPVLNALQNRLQTRGFRVVSVNVDDAGKAKSIAAEHSIAYPVLLGSEALYKDFGGVWALPTSFIIGRDGKLKDKIQGVHSESDFLKKLEPYL